MGPWGDGLTSNRKKGLTERMGSSSRSRGVGMNRQNGQQVDGKIGQ
jgi:hypothetical protein